MADPCDRFARDLAACGVAGDAPVLLAVSGGPDSMALLLMSQPVLGARCQVATVDHGLRPEAADEAALVAALCAERGIPHATLAEPMPARADGTANISARARALRYRLLERHADAIGARHILTAHHADDQAETLVMRLNRGSGVAGLAGVRARQGRVRRPLLSWRRTDLAEIVAAAGVASVQDPSNTDPRYDRSRVRMAMAEAAWLDPVAWATSAALLADAQAALDWSVERLAGERIMAMDDALTLDPAELPAELRRRLVARCIARIDPAAAPRGAQLAALVSALDRGGSGMLGNVLAQAEGGAWQFRLAPPRRSR